MEQFNVGPMKNVVWHAVTKASWYQPIAVHQLWMLLVVLNLFALLRQVCGIAWQLTYWTHLINLNINQKLTILFLPIYVVMNDQPIVPQLLSNTETPEGSGNVRDRFVEGILGRIDKALTDFGK